MIYKNENQFNLEFGTGDIGINGGVCIDKDNNKIGLVGFSNQSPREIGAVGDIKAGQPYKIEDFPVIMSFTKKESIDVVIAALIDSKNAMEE